MTRKNKIIILIMIIATLFLGSGYAAIQNITLNVIGTVSAEAPVQVKPQIGDYVDLGNDIVNYPENSGTTGVTTDDWRILNINDDGTMELILAGFLPNSYVSDVTDLKISGTYCIYSDKNRETLLNAFRTSSNWEKLAVGIPHEKVIGTPTDEQLIRSYNTKNNTNVDIANPVLDNSLAGHDLYIPYGYVLNGECSGYWLDKTHANANLLWRVSTELIYPAKYDITALGVRPVVYLLSDTLIKLIDEENKIWKVVNSDTSVSNDADIHVDDINIESEPINEKEIVEDIIIDEDIEEYSIPKNSNVVDSSNSEEKQSKNNIENSTNIQEFQTQNTLI